MKFSRLACMATAVACMILTTGNVVAAPKAAPAAKAAARSKTLVFTARELREAGWQTGQMMYPVAARQAGEQGTVYVEMTTDGTGKIIRATTPKLTKTPLLDAFVAAWVKIHWRGLPNVRATTYYVFRLR